MRRNFITHCTISLIATLSLFVLCMINLGMQAIYPQTQNSSTISAIIPESLYLFAIAFDRIFEPQLPTSSPNLSPRLSGQK